MKVKCLCNFIFFPRQSVPSFGMLSGKMSPLCPIIKQLKSSGRTFEWSEAFKTYLLEDGMVEVLVGGWTQKSLMELYVDCSENSSEASNLKLLMRISNQEVSDE